MNLCLNYAYGVLEGECRNAINTVGLEPAFGFLHEPSRSQTSQSLVYDLQEPFRWLCDVTVIETFESNALDLKDFYFMGDDYRYHIEVEAKRRLLGLLRDIFNAGVMYKGKTWKWDTNILNKAQELACFLLGRSVVDFTEPAPRLLRYDDRELRARILTMTSSHAKQLGIGKSTLHYLRKNAESNSPLRVYRKVKRRLDVATSSPRIEV